MKHNEKYINIYTQYIPPPITMISKFKSYIRLNADRQTDYRADRQKVICPEI